MLVLPISSLDTALLFPCGSQIHNCRHWNQHFHCPSGVGLLSIKQKVTVLWYQEAAACHGMRKIPAMPRTCSCSLSSYEQSKFVSHCTYLENHSDGGKMRHTIRHVPGLLPATTLPSSLPSFAFWPLRKQPWELLLQSCRNCVWREKDLTSPWRQDVEESLPETHE